MSGELRVRSQLDRERTEVYMLNITVYDQGVDPRQKAASRLLRLVIKDANDNPPSFIKSAFSFFFPENSQVGAAVVTLNATDPDDGVYGEVRYELQTDTAGCFALDPESGSLTVSRPLDRETREFYDLTVKAYDADPVAPLSSYAVVRVRVVDVNDVAPKFTSAVYTVKAREDLPLGAVVATVTASDPDLYEGGRVRYTFADHQDHGSETRVKFEVDELSGSVRIREALDYEKRQVYNITVKAFDLGSPSLSSITTLYVEVIDVNENIFPPKFESFFLRASVRENKPVGSHVAKVTAIEL